MKENLFVTGQLKNILLILLQSRFSHVFLPAKWPQETEMGRIVYG